MYKIGLCSVTFRALEPEAIISLAVQAGVKGIEWGADVHVPPDDIQRAIRIGERTREAGLEIVSYGSYYRAGTDDNFQAVLTCAIQLQAPAIRIWAGVRASGVTDYEERLRIVQDIKRVATVAAKEDILIYLEYHRDTLTDTCESAKKLAEEINHPAVCLYWQPAVGDALKQRKSIHTLNPYISNLHVFHWTETERLPLASGFTEWQGYLQEAAGSRIRYLLLEFVRGDKPQQFLDDIKTLKHIVSSL